MEHLPSCIEGFMFQGGIQQEISDMVIPRFPNIQTVHNYNHNYNGTIAMADTGQPNSGSSEFFINIADNGNEMPPSTRVYPAFGKVISGMDVVMAISHVLSGSKQ